MGFEASAKFVIRRPRTDELHAFGKGCVMLLEGVEREHSLNKAAKNLGMAYSKAWKLMNDAEEQLGCPLIFREGAKGSTLTPQGEQALAAYREMQGLINNVINDNLGRLFGGFER